ncbi:MAG TPA: hypothetical protein VNH18_35475 [Bryobacteraceae bacterium]|nr:hypothetical protein [Bryobacteraceae bacterium]
MKLFRVITYRQKKMKEPCEADDMPWYVGIAWDDFFRHQTVYCLLGLNVIARWVREAWLWARYRPPAKYSRLVEERDLFIGEWNKVREELRHERKERQRIEIDLRLRVALEGVSDRLRDEGWIVTRTGRAFGQPNAFRIEAHKGEDEGRGFIVWQEAEGQKITELIATLESRFYATFIPANFKPLIPATHC